jgi:peroxiredoxin
MRSDITEGNIFPDYELPDHTGVNRKLSFLQGHDPMVIMLGRGVWCPKDRMQLRDLVHFSKQCAVGFTRLVTITTDNLMLSNDLRLGVGADWPFLHDQQRLIAKDLDIEEYTDPHNRPMIPHTIVLEPGLKIYKIYCGYWFWGRPSTAELHQDLRAITQKIRPDYKIDTPEMRAKWDANDKANFYPYGMSWEQVFIRMANEVAQFEDPKP